MSFADTEYLPFLALVVLLWPFVPVRLRPLALLSASYSFYVWHGALHALWLPASTAIDYFVGLGLGRTDDRKKRRLLLATSLVLNLALLCTFKYASFAVANWSAVSGLWGAEPTAFAGFLLPLGISFYTFQTLSYTFDVYQRRIEPCRNPVDYALFVSFFPQLVAGPIERAGHLLPQLKSMDTLRAENVLSGAGLVLWGLLKKVVVADRLFHLVWEPVFLQPELHDGATLLLVSIALVAILYLDFSAYTDMARGSARLFGIELVHNFDRPFLSTSIAEWARRWHMSLMRWMYDYVYVPLARGAPSRARIWYSNLLVMGLFGLWHGASWTFVFWGLSYGVVIAIQQSRRLSQMRRGERRSGASRSRWRAVGAWALTLVFAAQFIVLFFAQSLSSAGTYYRAQFNPGLPADADAWRWFATTLGGLAGLFVVHASTAFIDVPGRWKRIPGALRTLALLALGYVILRYRVPDVRPFIYFEF